MKLIFFISRRYFFSRKKKNFINAIAIISMLVVSIGTASLIIALSVFNGMEGLLRSIYNEFDAPIQIVPKVGKSFELTNEIDHIIRSMDGVIDYIDVVEDNALLKYNNSQMIVKVKGLSQNFIKYEQMKPALRQGNYQFHDGANHNAIIGRGILYKMGISLKNKLYPLQLFYPKNIKPGVSLNANKYYNHSSILAGGVFALEQSYDNSYIFVPIEFAEKLFDYAQKRTSIEILCASGTNINSLKQQLSSQIGDRFEILTADQQHADIYKVLQWEKLFIFITFSLIVGIASINIFFSLSMLVTEKKADISIMMAMGASKGLIRKVFFTEGAIIAFVGAISGLLLGLLIAWSQQQFGFIKMGVTSAVTTAYPIKIIASDFFYTAASIIFITILASIHPALRAARSNALYIK